uniref:Uncharacterized protein n=1 Tax=viral metagenome TaxID=1070528 RepID=A0A6C0CFI7_9ZZZZ
MMDEKVVNMMDKNLVKMFDNLFDQRSETLRSQNDSANFLIDNLPKMEADYRQVLQPFVTRIRKGGIYTVEGVEAAFLAFVDSFEIKVYKPPETESSGYVKTTLQEAVEASKRPVQISVEVNSFGNMESLVYPGLIFKEDLNDKQWTAHGLQDDSGNIVPLTMNAVLVCRANGWRFNGKNLGGSASLVSSELRK